MPRYDAGRSCLSISFTNLYISKLFIVIRNPHAEHLALKFSWEYHIPFVLRKAVGIWRTSIVRHRNKSKILTDRQTQGALRTLDRFMCEFGSRIKGVIRSSRARAPRLSSLVVGSFGS